MSDNVPLEVVEKILNRLPIKSLIRFRSVSKTWKSLIESSDFILHYTTHLQHLLVYYDESYVSIAEDDCFPKHRVHLSPPLLVKLFQKSLIIGCSHGLLCLIGDYREDSDFVCKGNTAVIWNPSIRKAVAVVLPNVEPQKGTTIVGFGVCPETSDPKIVNMTEWCTDYRCQDYRCQVEVFSLSTGAWRSVTSNPPRKSISSMDIFNYQVVVDGFIYWLAYDSLYDDSESYIFIVSFNLTSEEFGEVILPDSLADGQDSMTLYISKIRKSLVVLERDQYEMGFLVWRMTDGVPKSFTKLFHIYIPDVQIIFVLEFMKSGEAVVDIHREHNESLVVYEPATKHTKHIGFEMSHVVHSYMETLLLLDQPHYIVYDTMGKRYIPKWKDTKEPLVDEEVSHLLPHDLPPPVHQQPQYPPQVFQDLPPVERVIARAFDRRIRRLEGGMQWLMQSQMALMANAGLPAIPLPLSPSPDEDGDE